MKETREMREKYAPNVITLRQIHKNISKPIRKDISKYKSMHISEIIENNKSLKVYREN